jgi:N utilization substance protein B
MRPRSLARRLALQYLYMTDLAGAEQAQPLDDFLFENTDDAETRGYARLLVAEVAARREEVDGVLSAAADNWSLKRIAAVERAVLRLGCTELLAGETPPIVAVNEAVRLAKLFGGANSGGFVNGILDQVLNSRRRDIDA